MIGVIDVLLVLVFGGVAFAVANEGVWSAVMTALSVLLAGLLAMNFFEPAAGFLVNTVGLTGAWEFRADFIALVGLFAVFVGLLRFVTYKLSPFDFETPEGFNELGRWAAGGFAGWITMSFLLAALHTAPMPREFLGFTPERRNLFNLVAPDRQWLGFTQYCSNNAFATIETVSVDGEPPIRVRRLFDGAYLNVPGSSQKRWPSFPIRYATRREQFAGTGGAVDTAPAPSLNPTIQAPTPDSPGTRRGGGGAPPPPF